MERVTVSSGSSFEAVIGFSRAVRSAGFLDPAWLVEVEADAVVGPP